MIFQDIVALAKAGWTPKQIKEVLEAIETSPKVREAAKEEVLDKKEESKEQPKVDAKNESAEPKDDLQSLIDILKEE